MGTATWWPDSSRLSATRPVTSGRYNRIKAPADSQSSVCRPVAQVLDPVKIFSAQRWGTLALNNSASSCLVLKWDMLARFIGHGRREFSPQFGCRSLGHPAHCRIMPRFVVTERGLAGRNPARSSPFALLSFRCSILEQRNIFSVLAAKAVGFAGFDSTGGLSSCRHTAERYIRLVHGRAAANGQGPSGVTPSVDG